MASAAKALEAGNVDEETKRHYNRAAAQFKACLLYTSRCV